MSKKQVCCKKHLEEHKLTYGDIATLCNCSITTVGRVARSEGINLGRGRYNFWQFTSPSKQLSYIIGAYLTDGTINKTAFSFTNTSKFYRDMVHNCLLYIGAPSKKKTFTLEELQKYNPKTKKQQYVCYSYCKLFCEFLITQTNSKQIIPDFFKNCNLSCKLALVAAIIDGDGRIRKDGSIEVRGVENFLFDLNDMVKSIGVKTNDIRIESVLPSGKEYRSLSINRSGFTAIGGYCTIPRKMSRILYGKNTRTRNKKAEKKTTCPACGLKIKSKEAKMCRACYLKSDELLSRLKKQSKRANAIANKVRWS